MGRRAVATIAAAVFTLTRGFVFVPAQAAESGGGAEASRQFINRTLTLIANKKKVEKGKKVKLSGRLSQDPAAAPGVCTANQPVELTRRKPGADDFETFKTVQTNAQGQYKSKVKVKKKTEFFSRAPSNGDCFLATGDNIFVKVKNKK